MIDHKIADEWKLFEGEYEKEWYDIKTMDGTIHKHCWPNAGFMNAVHSKDSPKFGVGECYYRLSITHPLD